MSTRLSAADRAATITARERFGAIIRRCTRLASWHAADAAGRGAQTTEQDPTTQVWAVRDVDGIEHALEAVAAARELLVYAEEVLTNHDEDPYCADVREALRPVVTALGEFESNAREV